jgi:hypothetical protein
MAQSYRRAQDQAAAHDRASTLAAAGIDPRQPHDFEMGQRLPAHLSQAMTAPGHRWENGGRHR